MKKNYLAPASDLIYISSDDVITTSPNGNEIDVGSNGDSLDLPMV